MAEQAGTEKSGSDDHGRGIRESSASKALVHELPTTGTLENNTTFSPPSPSRVRRRKSSEGKKHAVRVDDIHSLRHMEMDLNFAMMEDVVDEPSTLDLDVVFASAQRKLEQSKMKKREVCSYCLFSSSLFPLPSFFTFPAHRSFPFPIHLPRLSQAQSRNWQARCIPSRPPASTN
jgi:hypothetical protein